ncbi:MAG: L,D-transpeptidase [Proteobacteria bacterium]|nr:L,D-transpeptidase [Pseudomonadota bacterium]
MQRHVLTALVLSALGAAAANAEPLSLDPSHVHRNMDSQPPAVRVASARASTGMGGGFIEFLFGGDAVRYSAPPGYQGPSGDPAPPTHIRVPQAEPAQPDPDPKYRRQVVAYDGAEKPGTVVVDTPRRFLFLVQGDGKAIRYGIGVGRPGFTWAGVKQVTMKKEWPDWRPPKEMLQRRPDLPRYMVGGPENPLGARALYLGSSLYRIHGSNEPWTIGQAVSSGCIRMRNEDVIDLYERVKVGGRVIVI